MREPAVGGWLSMADEDEVPDDIEFDPRWEVQPTPDLDGDSDGNRRWILITVLAIVVLAASFVWLLSTSSAI